MQEVTLDDIDAIGVTYGPGLVGALLVGVAEAKQSHMRKLPLVGVHHIEGHISANYIENLELEPPFLCLVVVWGDISHLVCVKDYGTYEILGRTRDDAAGEAFDKVARAIGRGIVREDRRLISFKRGGSRCDPISTRAYRRFPI